MCNTGVGLTPLVDGKVHHFEFRGLYDGVSILGDRETGSIWHHITGESMYGPLAGKKLPTYNLLQMTVREAIGVYPDLPIAISDRPITGEEHPFAPWAEKIPVLGQFFKNTMAPEDTRRPSMDIGMGVWSDRVQRYYSMESLGAADNIILDELDGRRIAVYYAPTARAPDAIYIDATAAEWDGRVLRFDNGFSIRDGTLYDANGRARPMERPMQLFTRWYGYALTFPETEVYTGRD